MNYFKDKVAIVTGGASGIGRGLSEGLSQKGATVIIADINKEKAQKTVLRINNSGGTAYSVPTNVSKEDDVQRLVNTIVSDFGHLDFMFNNAGIVTVGEVRDMEIKHWQDSINVNLWGVIYGTLAAYQIMLQQGWGHIVNMSSIGGLTPFVCEAPYTAARFAVVGLSSALRIEAADLGIRVSVVCPGTVDTDILQTCAVLKMKRDEYLKLIPWKKMDVDKAAMKILIGVSKNKAMIVFPFISGQLIKWGYKYFPALWGWVGRTGLKKKIRAMRTDM